ncbi:MAG: sulfatase [Chthoniobacteraceae bacterium]
MTKTFLCLLVTAVAALAKDSPPNFIVINIDDLGYADIQPFGSELNRTPNLNRMAQEGMKLTCFYAAPVCTPSRSALMTGCYPKRVMPIASVLFPAGKLGLNPEEQTVAEVLKGAGYATACVGKWHLGDQPEFLPTRQGFDFYFGIPYSNDMGPLADGSKSNLGDPLPQPKSVAGKGVDPKTFGGDETGLKGAAQPPLPLLRNEKVIARVRAHEQTELVARYTDEAVGFIRENKAKPFFIYLPHSAVHFPLYPGKAFQKKSRNGYYGDWVEEVDWSVGRVLDTLRELGLAEKTLVIFTSDNGGTARGVNAPLRGGKGSTWEGGMRVPTIAWWPGKVPAGATCDAITGMIDVLPTFAKLAGAKLPVKKIDGVDAWPLLSGQAKQGGRDLFYFYRGLKLEAVRQGSWKLHLAKGELYNLESDIGEATNVAKENAEVVAQLQALAAKTSEDLGPEGIGPGVRQPGRVENAQPLIGLDGKVREGFADGASSL